MWSALTFAWGLSVSERDGGAVSNDEVAFRVRHLLFNLF